MKKTNLLLCAALIAAAFTSCSSNQKSSNSDTTTVKTDSTTVSATKTDSSSTAMADTTFASKAAVGGMAEVALGKMAAAKSSDAKIKDFGNMMVKDHGKANDELMAIAKKENITLPATLDAEHQAKSDSLSKLNGKDFDKAYVAAMIEGHQKTLALMQSEAANGKDVDLKAFAAKTAPIVQMHLDAIQKINANMK